MRVPRPLVAVWEWWKPIAHAIGVFQTKVILTVLYFLLLGPFAPMFLAKDPLGARRAHGWRKFQSRAADLAAARRQ
jgi:hypothetical protein